MHTSKVLRLVIVLLVAAAALAQQTNGEHEPLWRRVLRMSDAEQVAFTKSALDEGLVGEQGSALGMMALNRSSLIVPIIEKKIEEVVKSSNPSECFTRRDVDPQAFLGTAIAAITSPANDQALRGVSKLLKLDEKRFDRLVRVILYGAASEGNGFTRAYQGLEIADPAVNKRIVAWVEEMLAHRLPEGPGGPPAVERQWATVLVERYGGVPVQEQWQRDPIVSQLKPALAASAHNEVYRFAVEEWEKNPRHILAMTDSELVSLTKARLDRAKSRFDEGLPVDRWDTLFALARIRSSTVLPVIQGSIEDALKTPQSIVKQKYLGICATAIADAADEPAIRLAGKLSKQEPFRGLVGAILREAANRANPFGLSYRALEMNDPELEKQVIAWAEYTLAEPTLNIPKDRRRQWAETLADRYGAAPTAAQWSKDPLASRLKLSSVESFHSEVVRLAGEAAQKRVRN